MAYIVSQLRKDGIGNNTYMQPILVQESFIYSPNTFGGTTNFTDFALAGVFEKGKVYYLRFAVHKIPQYFYSGSRESHIQVNSYQVDADSLSLQLLLKNSQGEDDQEKFPPERIGSCFVPTDTDKNSRSYSYYSFIFSPSRNFNRLGFRINRVSYDAIVEQRDWLLDQSQNRQLDIEDVSRMTADVTYITITTMGKRIFYNYDQNDEDENRDGDICILKDLVSTTPAKDYGGWLKFGYQCRPGSLIVVNKQPIRLGRSGIYEINNGTLI